MATKKAKEFGTPQTWFRINTNLGEIEERPGVVRASEKKLWYTDGYGHQVEAWRTDFFPTHREAAVALERQMGRLHDEAKRRLEKAQEEEREAYRLWTAAVRIRDQVNRQSA